MRTCCLLSCAMLVSICTPFHAAAQAPAKIQVQQTDDYVQIDTELLQARVRKHGYVSGIAQGSFLDKKTGAKDIGFGLHIMDFLLAPGWKDDGYGREPKIHGNLPKHYVEGPQICTQAKKLEPEVIQGNDFVAIRLRWKFTQAAPGLKPGSLWEQTLVFQPDVRYVLCGEQITSVNDVDDLFYRIDMPGHVRHQKADTFHQVYLSYQGKIAADAFAEDFGPDQKHLYQRRADAIPKRMIRAYQVKVNGQPGPWLGGLTLDPAAVSEAWCHQRGGYICFIQELHGHKVKAGETFGAAYAVGWFDSIEEMEAVCDRHHGVRGVTVKDSELRLGK